ncbi:MULTISPECIES: hypothetical protein [Rhodanobacter]|uniref:hypothetical protein n=1 Tax=Rhodanobacter TaxID=75309 RepID=UPI0003F60343|nr:MULTISPECIES: hypothetical protein [Rhodanobacter]UJJ52600.1 hypothetical protein LRK52_07910 [Rhodanobacter denitrificans]UJM95354.1 hypothetical protein LRK32_07950 [Rhodanobacter denitrificans]UJM98885.1 hypothetical protein LRK44_07955 [Rhodanobacter denitrificans]UJN21700.1 hypothetical protein LRK54_00540 [Rhodanobacter denitrificans]
MDAARRRVSCRRFVPGAALAAVAVRWWRPGGDMARMQGGQPSRVIPAVVADNGS